MKNTTLVPIYVRVDASMIKRLDALGEIGFGQMKRTTLVRRAIELGVEELEKSLKRMRARS